MNVSRAFYSWQSQKDMQKLFLFERENDRIVTVFFSLKIVLILQIFGF